jgi:hypothetical protein
MGDDAVGIDHGRVPGRVAVGHQDYAIAQRHRAAAGRVHAHLGLHAGNHQPVDAGVGQASMEIGVVEGTAVPLLDHDLAGLRRDQRMVRPARRSFGEHMARAAIVLHMHDRLPFGAGTGQQAGDAPHDLFTTMGRRRDSEHALLDIDDHQRARHRATVGENVAARKSNAGDALTSCRLRIIINSTLQRSE